MKTNYRVRHVASGFWMPLQTVLAGIANCALAWVVEGESFRTLTTEESVIARNERARLAEPLDRAEIVRTKFKAPARIAESARASRVLAHATDHFYASMKPQRNEDGSEKTERVPYWRQVREAQAAALSR